jgi:putative membrane protein
MEDRVAIEHFFGAEYREKLKGCVREVESKTAGEIAIVVIDRSEAYRDCEMLGGLFFGGAAGLVLTEIFFHGSVWAFVPLTFLLFFPFCHLFRKVPALTVAMAGRRRKARAVRERSVRAFYERGLYRTRHGTGVLFFISVLERKVWVLADKGIYERITHQALNGLAAKVSQGMREGRALPALCEAIEELGIVLAEHFPVMTDDRDELPDGVIFEKSP